MSDGRKMLRADDPTKVGSGKPVVAHLNAEQYRQAFNLALHHKTSLAEAVRIALRNECEREGLSQ